uniref:Uncharacterized protein n=1 Tax=viral metagenome TaxID=1070528 RepID=A0A6C0J5M8_9ZZZZ
MTDFHEAFNCINQIDANSSGFNLTDKTESYGFKKVWNLGGDSSHTDFCYWLDGYFTYTYSDLSASVYQSFLAATTDAIRIYDKHVLFVLDMFYKAGEPDR